MNEPRIRVLELSFLLLLGVLSYGFYLVIRPFVLSIFLALVFTSILYPTHERLTRLVGDRVTLSSLLMVLGVLVVVAIPVSVVALLVYSEAVAGYSAALEAVPRLAERLNEVSAADWIRRLPLVGGYIGGYVEELGSLELSTIVRNAIGAGSNFVITATQRSFVSAAAAFANLALVLFLMFFLFAGGKRLVARIYDVVPIPNRELRQIAEETRRTAAATLISTFLIGLIEGAYGAILFLVFGLPSPFLWGIVIMVLSMIPLVGTNLVLVPAGIVLIATGRLFAGMLMILLGLGGVALTQNVIKPKLLGDRSGLHPALALLATLGGIAWLGLIGFLVGPLLAALFLVVWQQFGERYRRELDSRDHTAPDAATPGGDSASEPEAPRRPRQRRSPRP